MQIKFKKLSDTAITPYKAHHNDAAFDLFADANEVLHYGETLVIPTNIALELPDGYMADVRPRSGLTSKTCLRVQYGTIDSGYRGNIGIICENANHYLSAFNVNESIDMGERNEYAGTSIDTDIYINRGDKIAQLVIQRIPEIELIEADNLTDSDRGNRGFGSTGN